METNWFAVLLIVLMSYLLGSIPVAYIIGKIRHINIFEVGSGNMGGTNMARALGLHWGILTIILDALKGILAVLIALFILPSNLWLAFTLSAIVVVVGHNWSLFASLISTAANKGRFTIRGGKGGATAFGTLLLIAPAPIIVVMVTSGIILVIITRYASLGVLVAFTIAFVWLTVLVAQGYFNTQLIPYIVSLSGMIYWRFRENIRSLWRGTERKLGERATA